MSTISNSARAAMLDGLDGLVNTGSGTATITVYENSTALCVFELSDPAFAGAHSGSMTLRSLHLESTGTEVAGKANRFILEDQDGNTMLTGTISAIGGGGDIETPSLTVTAATTQVLNGFVLRMATDGTLTVEGSLTLT